LLHRNSIGPGGYESKEEEETLKKKKKKEEEEKERENKCQRVMSLPSLQRPPLAKKN